MQTRRPGNTSWKPRGLCTGERSHPPGCRFDRRRCRMELVLGEHRDPGDRRGDAPAGIWDVVAVGAAAGLWRGAGPRLGARVLLLEEMEKPARELHITGKDPNLANVKPLEDSSRRSSRSRGSAPGLRRLLRPGPGGTLREQESKTKTEGGGRMFPVRPGLDVAAALVAWAQKQGARYRPCPGQHLLVQDGAFTGLDRCAPLRPPGRLGARTPSSPPGACPIPPPGSADDGFPFSPRPRGTR